ncbi:hypothetical protein DASC09_021900 [Saccharomycopsis crataegensis]|uniref:Carboxypeptidase n=1 Tax=Saccharomycopsis crataegensis TaxID=43959 RepID=A0AAV5QKI0_9ASCO|nr:hypothetical protein DASC09_021900 [Saccharomycopsis crataegensis]
MFKIGFLISLLFILQAAYALPLTEALFKQNKILKRATCADDYSVKNLPGLDKMDPKFVPEMHAGYIQAEENVDEDYFFWKFSKNQTESASSDRLILWFNGGPGCSSMAGALAENGPLTLNDNDEVVYSPGTWIEEGDLVFIDQPGGVGFSDSNDYSSELKDIAANMMTFLKNYFEVFPEDKAKDLYLSGESYAGQYIPYFGAKILAEETDINLKGLLIFNGYIYPDVQQSALFEFGVENNIISQSDADEAQDEIQECIQTYESNQQLWASVIKEIEANGEYEGENDFETDDNKVESYECIQLLNEFLLATYDTSKPEDELCINVYDFRLRDSSLCGSNSFPPNHQQINDFLNSATIDEALNLKTAKNWSDCDSGTVGENLVNYYSYPAFFKLPYILSKIPILIAAGENDIICNIKGLEKMVSVLTWGDKLSPGFSSDIEYANYGVDGTTYGTVKQEGNLMFAGISNASHMAPYSQPIGSRALIDIFFGDFIKNGSNYVAPSHGDF